MTVVGAVKFEGHPMLVGDVVISEPVLKPDEDPGDAESWVAFARKIYEFGPNLALGWTGNALSAAAVVARLHDAFQRYVTRAELVQALASIRDAPGVTMVGWLVEDAATCVVWSSAEPAVVHASHEGSVLGSGSAAMCRALAGDGRGNLVGVEAAILKALTSLGDLRFQEEPWPQDWDTSFGGAYEIMVFHNGQFRWVSPITYVAWNIRVARSGSIASIQQVPVVWTQRSDGERLLMQKKSALENRWENSVSVPLREAVQLDRDALKREFATREFRPKAEFYVNFFHFSQAGRRVSVACAVTSPNRDGIMWAEGDGRDLTFGLNRDQIARIFRDVTGTRAWPVGTPCKAACASFRLRASQPSLK